MTDVVALPITSWDQPCSREAQQAAVLALESGNVLQMPQLGFPLLNGEERLLSPAVAAQSKNVSLDPNSGALRGSSAGEADLKLLHAMMTRFAEASRALICKLVPRYEADLRWGRTSYRPIEIAGRSTSWRKDDTRLHVDSFPSTPMQGRRTLRFFANINPQGRARTWRLGESFEDLAQRFARSIPAPIPGASLALDLLGVTKSRRSDYDHYMLRLHDHMKADTAYQSTVAQQLFEFPPGCTWLCFTDQVSHAAMGGQYALEQTFYLPVDAMSDPARSPLRVLERVIGRPLI